MKEERGLEVEEKGEIMERIGLILIGMLLCCLSGGVLQAQEAAATEATPVLHPENLLSTPVGGLERTQAKTEIVPVSGQSFPRALRVIIGGNASDTNAPQLTLPILA